MFQLLVYMFQQVGYMFQKRGCIFQRLKHKYNQYKDTNFH